MLKLRLLFCSPLVVSIGNVLLKGLLLPRKEFVNLVVILEGAILSVSENLFFHHVLHLNSELVEEIIT